MTIKFTNNASGTLASSITTSSTTITLTTGQGALFPSLSSGEYFFATLADSSNNLEIVKCTARATDVLTVVRAQDGTTARAFIGGDRFELRITAAGLNGILTDAKAYTDVTQAALSTHISNPSGAHAASAISNTPAGNIAATTVQAAINELDTEKLAATATVSATNGITASGSSLASGITLSPTVGYNSYGVRTVSTSAPSGGNDGDIWYKV